MIKGDVTIKFKDGSKYTGACSNNMMNGFGKLISTDGKTIHDGAFKDN